MVEGALEALSPAPVEDSDVQDPPARSGPDGGRDDVLDIAVPLGRRVLVVANLGLASVATPATAWAAAGLAGVLDGWDGPGVVAVAGNLVAGGDGSGSNGAEPDCATAARAAMDAHPRLAEALARFTADAERRVVLVPGDAEGGLIGQGRTVLRCGEGISLELARAVDLRMETAAGTRVVRVAAGLSGAAAPPTAASHLDHRAATARLDDALEGAPHHGGGRNALVPALSPDPSAPWQEGLHRLADPAATPRFLTSRLLYRRFARLAWWLLVPFVAAIALRFPFVSNALDHLVFGQPARALRRAHEAGWVPRLLFAAAVCVAELLILAVVLGWVARKAWRALGGGPLPSRVDPPLSEVGVGANDALRDAARGLCQGGYAGLVSGATLQAELTHLGGGFFAGTGAAGEVVEERGGRLGMPPVFLACRQLAWIELETGAELHVRLLVGTSELPGATFLERMAARDRRPHEVRPAVVAAYPHGSSWPLGPDLSAVRVRSRRVRRMAAAAIAIAGVLDLLTAVTPPLRGRLHLVLQLIPYGATRAAGALVALVGIGLLALARGVRRGQRRAHAIAVAALAASLVLHLVRGGEVGQSLFALLVLAFLAVNRREFPAESDRPSLRSAVVALVGGVVGITVVTTVVVETTLRIDLDRPHIPLWRAGQAVLERLVGIRDVALPDRLDDFLSPSLLAVGVALAVVAVMLATRPLVDRRRSGGRAAEARARDIVRRHGHGTLDYFALRSDKQWYFHRDSLVAYAIYSGICLVSPDPIGPSAEREQVWGAFRRFADDRGWIISIMGASETWLPAYRATGMHDIYIGDEAVVDVNRFNLKGGHMKGLRQAYNRIAKYGYTATFHDPSRLDRVTAERLTPLMSQSRRGEFERGFSMVLGRIFDPRDEGLVLCVVTAPDGTPAAMCQFVPAPGIGGFSLDLMRRDRGEHPNGLIDFALVSTIEHLRSRGCNGLSLNFAALRSVLEGERGDGPAQRVERWALRRMSSFLQIETLWKFNAKYGPDWLPRYVVYDAAEHLVPVVLAILRAESLSEVPVIGRMIAASDRRAHAGAGDGAEGGEALLPFAEPVDEHVGEPAHGPR